MQNLSCENEFYLRDKKIISISMVLCFASLWSRGLRQLVNGLLLWHCLVSIETGWVRVGLLWDKQHETHILRQSTLRLWKIWSLVSIGTILNKIQLLTNMKIYKRCMDCRTHRLDDYIFLSKFWRFWMAVSRSVYPDKHQSWERC